MLYFNILDFMFWKVMNNSGHVKFLKNHQNLSKSYEKQWLS